MEHLLLKVLRFDVAVPTANIFCDRFLKEIKADEQTVALAMVHILWDILQFSENYCYTNIFTMADEGKYYMYVMSQSWYQDFTKDLKSKTLTIVICQF